MSTTRSHVASGQRPRPRRRAPVALFSLAAAVALVASAQPASAAANQYRRGWGMNRHGQLGLGGTAYTDENPTPVAPATDNAEWSQLASSGYHTLAIKSSDSSVWAWGNNNDGQLGPGTTLSKTDTPVQVTGITGTVVEVAAGFNHSLARTSEGNVWAWGDDHAGQLGDGTTSTGADSTPNQVLDNVTGAALTGVTGIGAGFRHSLAIVSGVGRSWGSNQHGQLGDGTFVDRNKAVVVASLTNITKIGGGSTHTVAVVAGTAHTWGSNDFGQLCAGEAQDTRNVPGPVTPSADATGILDIAVGGGGTHTLILKDNGQVKACGNGGFGRLGNGCDVDPNAIVPCQNEALPVSVVRGEQAGTGEHLNNIVAIAGCGFHSLAIDGKATSDTGDDSVFSWGDDGYGQLGNNTTLAASSSPVAVSGLSGVTQVGCGYLHSMALKATAA